MSAEASVSTFIPGILRAARGFAKALLTTTIVRISPGWDFALKRSLPRPRWLIDALILASVSIGALYATARFSLAPRDPARGVAVVFAPWTPQEATLTRTVEAGGRFVRFGGASFIAVAMPDDANYSARAFAAGAWLVLDPKALAACLSAFGVATADS